MIWSAAMVSRNMEMRCLNELRKNGYEAFVPLAKRWTKPSRKRKPVITTMKIFPGYVFLKIPDGSNFEFLKFRNVRMNFIFTYDKKGNPVVSEISENVIDDLLRRDEIGDLFDDFEKKEIRSSYSKNQLVCWSKGGNYSLGFVARNTQGKEFAHINIAGGVEAKIPVALLALL